MARARGAGWGEGGAPPPAGSQTLAARSAAANSSATLRHADSGANTLPTTPLPDAGSGSVICPQRFSQRSQYCARLQV